LAKAVTPKEDGDALARFTKEVQRLGPGVVAQRDYPAEARDKGWEGTVQIEVRYAAGGYIKSIVVGESSGHALLDEKAGELARALQLPDVPEELQSRDFTVRLPVSFRLR
jgi:protein TonB